MPLSIQSSVQTWLASHLFGNETSLMVVPHWYNWNDRMAPGVSASNARAARTAVVAPSQRVCQWQCAPFSATSLHSRSVCCLTAASLSLCVLWCTLHHLDTLCCELPCSPRDTTTRRWWDFTFVPRRDSEPLSVTWVFAIVPFTQIIPTLRTGAPLL